MPGGAFTNVPPQIRLAKTSEVSETSEVFEILALLIGAAAHGSW